MQEHSPVTETLSTAEKLSMGYLLHKDAMHTLKNNAVPLTAFEYDADTAKFLEQITSMQATIDTGMIGLNFLLSEQNEIGKVELNEVINLVKTAQVSSLENISFNLENAQTTNVNVNLYEIMSAFTVLMNNTSKYAFPEELFSANDPRKKISISLQVAASEKPEHEELTIIFADHGKGLNAEQMAKIFDPKQSDGSTDWHVGLDYLAKKIRNSGGKISASETVGGGLTITMTTDHPKVVQKLTKNFLLTEEQIAELKNTQKTLNDVNQHVKSLNEILSTKNPDQAPTEDQLAEINDIINKIKSSSDAIYTDIIKTKNVEAETKVENAPTEIKEEKMPAKRRVENPRNAANNFNILIIEDSKIILRTLKKALQDLGYGEDRNYTIICVDNGADALKEAETLKINKKNFGTIICDFEINPSAFTGEQPNSSGIDVAKALYNAGTRAQFIPFSGNILDANQQKIFDDLNHPFPTEILTKNAPRLVLKSIMGNIENYSKETEIYEIITPELSTLAPVAASDDSPSVTDSVTEIVPPLLALSTSDEQMPSRQEPEAQEDKNPGNKKSRSLSSFTERLEQQGFTPNSAFTIGRTSRSFSAPNFPG